MSFMLCMFMWILSVRWKILQADQLTPPPPPTSFSISVQQWWQYHTSSDAANRSIVYIVYTGRPTGMQFILSQTLKKLLWPVHSKDDDCIYSCNCIMVCRCCQNTCDWSRRPSPCSNHHCSQTQTPEEKTACQCMVLQLLKVKLLRKLT